MMYTKALCPALVVLWAGRGWAGLCWASPWVPPFFSTRKRPPAALGGGWQPRAEGRAALGPVGRRGTGISGGGRGGRPLRVEEEAGCTP